MKIQTSELTGAALDWAVAKCEGMTHPEPRPMTDTRAEKMATPFYLWEIVSNKDKSGNWSTTVEKVKVVRYGVDASVGATGPSISFIDRSGVMCRGSVNMFFETDADAKAAALYEASAYQWGEGDYQPSTDWAQGGPIMEREGIGATVVSAGSDDERWLGANLKATFAEYGPTCLVACMRTYVASKLGDEVDVPEELK